jgi:hypothetical protein
MVRFCVVALVACMFVRPPCNYAEDLPCKEVRYLVSMAKAPSIAAVRNSRIGVPAGYRADLVGAYRLFQLQPRSESAADDLLRLVPSNGSQQNVVMTLGDSLCSDESFAEMGVLARIRDNLPLQLSRAVSLAPSHMRSYIAYSRTATLDPHSDYAVRMQSVCLQKHEAFVKALNELPQELQRGISGYVIKPDTCRAIRFPEADR